MAVFNRHNIGELVFLELASISPLIIILGNIVPPFPIKLHYIGMGLIFLSSVWVLLNRADKKWLIYLALFYVLIQSTLYHYAWKDVIDFFFGPFALVVFIDLVVNKRVSEAMLRHYKRRFYYFMWIPITIAILQFFDILPVTFWNATYINYAKFGEVELPRPNGFLYHGSELSILITFVALFQYFKKEQEAVWTLLAMVIIALMTYFKAVLGCTLLLLLFYVSFVNRGSLSRFRVLDKKSIIAYSGIAIIVAGTFAYQYLAKVYFYTGYFFPQQLLTGRGAIWNIYLDGVSDFSLWNYIFGGGIGSGYEIFRDYAFADNFYPLTQSKKLKTVYDSHNALLSVFINAGVVGLAFFWFLFKMIYTQVKNWQPTPAWNKTVYFGVFVLPLLTIGVTIPIYDMAIFWICLGFLFCSWHDYAMRQKISGLENS